MKKHIYNLNTNKLHIKGLCCHTKEKCMDYIEFDA